MGRQPSPESLLKRAMLKAGRYYQSPDLFYQRLWWNRLEQIGLRVISVERLPAHPVWDIRLRGTLAAQAYLLVSKPAGKTCYEEESLLLTQLKKEVQHIAKELGERIQADGLSVMRNGTHLRLAFVWEPGKPGILRCADKKPEAFSFMIRPWLRRVRS